jgi:hypothetical protein
MNILMTFSANSQSLSLAGSHAPNPLRELELEIIAHELIKLTVQRVADGLRREKDSVMAALKYPWSTSPVEGHINKLKMIKRQMFGRAKLDLLKARVINY